MCLAIVALNAHPRLPLVIAANRDEFHSRDAAPAHWWEEGVLAGRDLAGGGTWFGVTRNGRWALVTNFREGVPRDPDAPSRGRLVTHALARNDAPLIGAAAIARDGWRYHGFNLLTGSVAIPRSRPFPGGRGETRESLRDYQGVAAHTSNRTSGAVALSCGIHGLSNHLLDTPWPKVVRSKARIAADLARGTPDVAALFELLEDRRQAEASALPSTGISSRWEQLLSSPFIVDAQYGTRCSTVLILDVGGHVRFVERSFDAEGNMTGEVAHEFALGAA
ncbi:MAG: NRDE family protein [Betaproteobacteria bacterium]|nr:MAG: NRDE family protein [Betaproteobacteria bacterium]TMH00623.1 MAG: NRDE family protein [Betaproteobacteria bacterium]